MVGIRPISAPEKALICGQWPCDPATRMTKALVPMRRRGVQPSLQAPHRTRWLQGLYLQPIAAFCGQQLLSNCYCSGDNELPRTSGRLPLLLDRDNRQALSSCADSSAAAAYVKARTPAKLETASSSGSERA
ncbi:hypothetical protein VTN96DRAFT_598 [Rasamsonia emersonii]